MARMVPARRRRSPARARARVPRLAVRLPAVHLPGSRRHRIRRPEARPDPAHRALTRVRRRASPHREAARRSARRRGPRPDTPALRSRAARLATPPVDRPPARASVTPTPDGCSPHPTECRRRFPVAAAYRAAAAGCPSDTARRSTRPRCDPRRETRASSRS